MVSFVSHIEVDRVSNSVHTLNIRAPQHRASLAVNGGVVSYLFSTQMFQPPSYFTVVIAATRIHRSLVDFTRRSTDVYVVLYPLVFSRSR